MLVHLNHLSFYNLRTVPTNKKRYFCLNDYAGKADLSKAIEIKKKRELGVTTHSFRDNLATFIIKNSKIQSNVWHWFFPN